MPDLAEELYYHVIAYGIVAAAAGLAALAIWLLLLHSRRRLLPLQFLRPVHWDGRQIILVFIILLFVPAPIEVALVQSGLLNTIYGENPSALQRQLWSGVLSLPFVVAGILLALNLLREVRPEDLGITTFRILQNLTIGCLAWFPLSLITLTVHFVVSIWITPEDHLLVELARHSAFVWEWVLIGLAAVVAAPLLEELVFRGVLLPWLLYSRLGNYGVLLASVLVAGAPLLKPAREGPLNPGPLLFVLILAPVYVWLLRRSETSGSETSGRSGSETSGRSGSETSGRFVLVDLDLRRPPQPRPAIFGSSLLWAIFHFNVWPSPIPLFVLGLGLGWLTYRTQSLVSAMVVHALFNSIAFLVLWSSV